MWLFENRKVSPFTAWNYVTIPHKKTPACDWRLSGGEGGIRTHGDLTATVLFESTPIVHSGTSPDEGVIIRD